MRIDKQDFKTVEEINTFFEHNAEIIISIETVEVEVSTGLPMMDFRSFTYKEEVFRVWFKF